MRLKTDIKENCYSSSKVSTPFELVRERRRTSFKKTNVDLLKSSLIKLSRESLNNMNPLHKINFQKNESLLTRSPSLLPVKLNLANKFFKMKMLNFEEDIPIPEDIIKENEFELTKRIMKDSSDNNFLSTGSSNDQSENSNSTTLKSLNKVDLCSQQIDKEKEETK